jgi:hypothetical protein
VPKRVGWKGGGGNMLEDIRDCLHIICLLVHKATVWQDSDSALFKVKFVSIVLEIGRPDNGRTSCAICLDY